MLRERLNSFLGLIRGLEQRRDGLIGDPFRATLPPILPNLGRGGGGIIIDCEGLLADCGRRSLGGDSTKHSLRDVEVDVESLLLPAPKRKGGS
jgi:hypothetical protein